MLAEVESGKVTEHNMTGTDSFDAVLYDDFWPAEVRLLHSLVAKEPLV